MIKISKDKNYGNMVIGKLLIFSKIHFSFRKILDIYSTCHIRFLQGLWWVMPLKILSARCVLSNQYLLVAIILTFLSVVTSAPLPHLLFEIYLSLHSYV